MIFISGGYPRGLWLTSDEYAQGSFTTPGLQTAARTGWAAWNAYGRGDQEPLWRFSLRHQSRQGHLAPIRALFEGLGFSRWSGPG